jgi:hypothetical protein
MPVAPSPDPAAAHPTAPEPVVPSIEARTTAPAPVDTGAAATPAETRPVPASSVGAQPARGTGRGGRGLNGRGRWKGRGVQRVGSAAVAHLLGQASLQVPEDLPDAGAALVPHLSPWRLRWRWTRRRHRPPTLHRSPTRSSAPAGRRLPSPPSEARRLALCAL